MLQRLLKKLDIFVEQYGFDRCHRFLLEEVADVCVGPCDTYLARCQIFETVEAEASPGRISFEIVRVPTKIHFDIENKALNTNSVPISKMYDYIYKEKVKALRLACLLCSFE